MKPRASAPKISAGFAGPRPVGELVDGLGEVLRVGDQRHEVLEDDPLAREVRDVADAVAEVDAHDVRSTVDAQVANEEQVRELLRDARQPLEIIERVLPALGIARAQARSDELLDERRLPTGSGEECPEVSRVDAEARQPRTGGSDVRLVLAVEALAAFDARDDQAELFELAYELRRDRGALAELGLVDLVFVAENADGAASRAVSRSAGAVELLANDTQRQELVALEPQDRGEALDVVGREEPIAATRAARRDEALVLEVADLRDGDVGELLAKLLAHRADRAWTRLRSPPLPACGDGAHRWRKVSRYLPICTSSSFSRTTDSMRRRLT